MGKVWFWRSFRCHQGNLNLQYNIAQPELQEDVIIKDNVAHKVFAFVLFVLRRVFRTLPNIYDAAFL